jgi:hypothetical protein
VPVRVLIRPTSLGEATRGAILETEPNDSICQAQAIPLAAGDGDQSIHITGGADDIEYFDNTRYGESGDDWYRIDYKGSEPRLLTCNMTPTDPFVTARLRFYTADSKEYTEGKNANETTHEQVEEHRTAIVRLLKPGGAYFLRVEANSPGYDLELRIRRPAPYSDARAAVRLGLYDHIAQVDAWLLNRPRGNSLDRRLRDTGSMYGSNCMSCHTQSGVWGPAGPIAFGYRIENAGSYRHLINVMYESLRPTNVLKDAANNTSLPPHDLGDGPAGTRVAGHNVRTLEAVIPPRKLHSAQQIRTANYMLQSADPSGINAAGKGSNVGQGVVFHYAAEILRTAWDKTGEARYLAGIEGKAEKLLALRPKFTDDIAHRVLFFGRVFPSDYAKIQGDSAKALSLMERARRQLEEDERALRASQGEDGSWGFTPGAVDRAPDPAPTALAVDALVSRGAGATDPAVARGVGALLRMQDPYGRWNRSAKTGFVTTSYVLHTLARLFPDTPRRFSRKDFEPQPRKSMRGESLQDTVARHRSLAHLEAWSEVSSEEPPDQYLDLMVTGATQQSAFVRYWAMIALGARHSEKAIPALIKGLGDPVKMVREAARWGLRQTLLDDKGWEQVFEAYDRGGDLEREQLAAALVMRADAVMSRARVDFERLAAVLDRMMNTDANPAVRAWAARAAWNWWLWNPPVRKRLNQAFVTMLETSEPSALAENAKRYQLQALFIVNGNRASANYDNPYPELTDLFRAVAAKIEPGGSARQISDRLVGVAATYYNAAYGSNGTGQMGYSTPHASEMIGKAVVDYWQRAEEAGNQKAVQLSIEAAANVIHEGAQKKLLHYAVKGPEQLRSIASSSLSDPRAVILPTSPEFVEPLIERVSLAATNEKSRTQIARTVIRQLSQARWDLSVSEERRRAFFSMLIPKLDDPSSEAQWFLAEQLGAVLGTNPDMQTETLLSLVPKTFRSQQEEYFWLPSVRWMLKFDTPVPEVGRNPWPENRADLRRFALDIFLRSLTPEADRRRRDLALRMLTQTELRSHPEVIGTVNRINAGDARRLLPEEFERELRGAVERDTASPKVALTSDRLRNFTYFRDYVIPELSLENREDGQSCFTCHGSGRVPSMELAAPDRRTGFLSAQDAWKNYRMLLERINFEDVAQSKVLQKPLNIQTGKEDGHQGGMRYKPGDRGHEVLKRWAQDATRVK